MSVKNDDKQNKDSSVTIKTLKAIKTEEKLVTTKEH